MNMLTIPNTVCCEFVILTDVWIQNTDIDKLTKAKKKLCRNGVEWMCRRDEVSSATTSCSY